jgi:hypothetical protein
VQDVVYIPVELSLHVIIQLKMLESFFPNKQINIWGHRMSGKQVRALVKECCRLGYVGYKGVHDFRKSGVEWHTKRLTNDPTWTRERLVSEIMPFVQVDPRLNPIVMCNGVVMRKYVPEDLMKRQRRWLISQYLSQVLGHNRNDSITPSPLYHYL